MLSTLNAPLVALKDASHVTLRGIHRRSVGLGDGIEVSGGSGDRIEACEVRNTRQLGIHVSGGTGHRVEACDIHDTGTGGLVLAGGDRKTLTPAGHEAVNNHIWRFSQHQLTYANGITLGGVGNRAAHNLIHDAPHQAIGISGNDHIFEYNVVHDVCTETDDCGALYKGRNPSCRGNIIRYNFWHDIGSPMGHGTAAVYFDDGDGGDTVFGNVFFRCGDPGQGCFGTVFSPRRPRQPGREQHLHRVQAGARLRAVGRRALERSHRRRTRTASGRSSCCKDVDITKPPYTTRYPESGRLHGSAARPAARQPREEQRAGALRAGQQRQLAVRAGRDLEHGRRPRLRDAAQGDFRLRPDAEVFKRLPGFQPIPFEKIGPQPRAADRSR